MDLLADIFYFSFFKRSLTLTFVLLTQLMLE